MKYRRIDKGTVQCIVTGEDLQEYGLTLKDIFERSERAEGFLRELIEEAHEEVGYDCTGSSIAMQITPMKDDGMIITFSEESGDIFKGFLEHMKEVVGNVASGGGIPSLEEIMNGLHENIASFEQKQSADETDKDKKTETHDDEQPEDVRVFEFASLNDVLAFTADGFGGGSAKSYFGKADDKYYLVVIKNRMSWKNFNKLSAKAFDYGNVIVDVKSKLVYLGEHGEGLIENGAIRKLAKVNK